MKTSIILYKSFFILFFLLSAVILPMDATSQRTLNKIQRSMPYKQLYKILQSPGAADYIKNLENTYEEVFKTRMIVLEAQILFHNGRFEQAKELLVEAKEKYPNDEDINFLCGVAFFPAVRLETRRKYYDFSSGEVMKIKFVYSEDEQGQDWLNHWYIQVRNEDDKVVYKLNDKVVPLHELPWDGRNLKGRLVDEGEYIIYAVLIADYNTRVYSVPHKIVVTSDPPPVQISIRQKIFIPGEDPIGIQASSIEDKKVKDWKLSIRNNRGKVVKTMSGDGEITANLDWDGKNDKKLEVSDGDIYQMQLTGKFDDGSKFESNPDEVQAAIKVKNIEDQIKFQLNSIEFDTGKATLKANSFRLLYIVADILNKYDWYNIVVRGHTDNVGSTKANQMLSETRAKSVVDYLVKSCKVDPERLQAKGIGENEPIASNDTEEGRTKNRRVEFVLKKVRKPDYAD